MSELFPARTAVIVTILFLNLPDSRDSKTCPSTPTVVLLVTRFIRIPVAELIKSTTCAAFPASYPNPHHLGHILDVAVAVLSAPTVKPKL